MYERESTRGGNKLLAISIRATRKELQRGLRSRSWWWTMTICTGRMVGDQSSSRMGYGSHRGVDGADGLEKAATLQP